MNILTPDLVAGLVATGASTRVDVDVPPRFEVGDEIIVRNINPTGHTRLPRYLHGKRGRIERDHGVFVLPDAHAHGQGEKPQHLYSVRFTSREVWGREGSPKDSSSADMFDDYLDPV
jgi:Nitrile hydratase beta subunit, C-terminal